MTNYHVQVRTSKKKLFGSSNMSINKCNTWVGEYVKLN